MDQKAMIQKLYERCQFLQKDLPPLRQDGLLDEAALKQAGYDFEMTLSYVNTSVLTLTRRSRDCSFPNASITITAEA